MDDPLAFVASHGVVLESSSGPVPSLAQAVAGEAIRGSWWAHPRADAILAATREARSSKDVLTCRAVRGKVTLIHRRLWPALIRLAPEMAPEKVAAVLEVHTRSGRHEVRETPYPQWASVEVQGAAHELTREEAIRLLGDWVLDEMGRRTKRGS